MRRYHWVLFSAGLFAGLLITGGFVLRAQDRARTAQPGRDFVPRDGSKEPRKVSPAPTGREESPPGHLGAKQSTSALTLQDALLRPYPFPFAQPTSLERVCLHLKQTLKAAVVLDLAALDRKSVKPEDTVSLDLEGARLKTGLKLLLDQVGLTYRVVAEDNLMIITDAEGSEDPSERIWSELRALHRDLHDVKDAIDELRDFLGDEGGEGPRVRKPTIIEELPEHGKEHPGNHPEKPGNAGQKPGTGGAPAPGSRPTPSRVPLAGPRRAL
jgi:hypothetical protein